MNVVPLTAEIGRQTGTGSSRRLRAEGKVPATVYGLGGDPVSVAVSRSELRRALSTPAGINALIELTYDGTSQYALVKSLQRHPVRREPIHLDFQRIDPEQPIVLTVPIHLRGEAKKVAASGGMIDQTLNALPVSVRPDSIPNEFFVDVSDMELDDVLTVADLSLPEGVTTDLDADTPVVTSMLTRAAIVAARAAAAAAAGEGEGEGDESAEAGEE
jgi:large subunit ribosomal protein L25